MKKTLRGPEGVTLELDSHEIYPEDPGQGTPAMVYKTVNGRLYMATLTCAEMTGELCADRGGAIELSETVCDWLGSDKVQEEVEEMYAASTDGEW